MNKQRGDLTVSDVGVPFICVVDEVITGLNIEFVFVKPSGNSIRRTASASVYNASYTSQLGDIDEDGEWTAYLYNKTSGYFYTNESGNTFRVRPAPEDMAV